MIIFYLTNKCNVNRGVCYDILKCSPSGQNDIWDKVPIWLAQAKELGFTEVSFSGGEITLDFDKLLALIIKTKELGFKIQAKTNGWWSKLDYAQRMFEAGLDELRISYDSKRFYPDSPLTREIVLDAIKQAGEIFRERTATIVPHIGEPDLYLLERLTENSGINLEVQPILETNFRVKNSIRTGFDPDLGKIRTVSIPYPFRNPTIDFKGRLFLNSEGIAEAENLGTFTDRYVGDLNKSKLSTLMLKYNVMTK